LQEKSDGLRRAGATVGGLMLAVAAVASCVVVIEFP
jgi:hypothetical protein